jgi:hypothetical protein
MKNGVFCLNPTRGMDVCDVLFVFSLVPNVLRSSESGTGATQPREDK